MQRVSKFIILVLVSLSLTNYLSGQNTYSPYSVIGVGDIATMSLTHNRAMGGLGISNGDAFHLNNKNPALLTYNRVVVFEAGIVTEQKSLKTTDLSQDNFTGGLNYLVIGFPAIRDKWTISFGLMPVTTVNYQSNELGFISGGTSQLVTTFEGTGGISQAYFATGLKITDRLSLGLRTSYIFGSIRKETVFFVEETSFQTAAVERNSFSDIALGLGAAYSVELKKDENYLNFGITYDIGGDRNVSRLERLERRDLSNDLISPDDTIPYLITDNIKGSIKLPSTVGLGVSFEKRFKWTIGVDLTLGQWSDYRDFSGASIGLKNQTDFIIGGSWTPDLFATSNYLKRITYRAGINYKQTPYVANNQDINDFGINFGVTLPLRNLSRLNLGFEIGQRGTTDNNLIQENYFKAFLGITVNDNKWFIRRKFD